MVRRHIQHTIEQVPVQSEQMHAIKCNCNAIMYVQYVHNTPAHYNDMLEYNMALLFELACTSLDGLDVLDVFTLKIIF